MASILSIGGRWRAQVRRPGQKSISRTFRTQREAEKWARQVEAAADNEPPAAAAAAVASEMTVERLIAAFRKFRDDAGRPVQAVTNTHYMLEHLSDDLGTQRVCDLTPDVLLAWAKYRREQGAGGYTVNMELSQLGTVIRHTAAYLRITLPDVVGAARPTLHYAQLITGADKRSRRPTEDELDRLIEWLDERQPVVADCVRVSAITGLRRGELARIAWADIDELRRAVLVRQRKHPRRIQARDEWVPLLGASWTVVQQQPHVDARIFPISAEKMTDSVTEATKVLAIPDLHFHDLRREATSALRERGFDSDARKAVTGHRSDVVHERYIAITMESLHAQYDAAAAQGIQPRPPRPRTGSDRQP